MSGSQIADDFLTAVAEKPGVASYCRVPNNKLKWDRKKKRGRGAPPSGAAAWVYVARCAETEMTKVGITSSIRNRMRQLGAVAHATWHVMTPAAIEIERDALDALGVPHGTEWTLHSPEHVTNVVARMICEANRRMHVFPEMTAEEARQRRVSMLTA